jgi:hypothetical protein
MKLAVKRERPALNLRSRRNSGAAADSSRFSAVVAEAIAVTEELNSLNAAETRKLTPAALFRETLASVQGSPERVAALRAAIEKGEPGLDHTRATLRRMIQFLRGPNWSFAPKEPRRLGFLTTEATNGELALRRSSSVELFCVAAQIAGENYPEAFGIIADSAKWEGRVAELKSRQADLFAQIGSTLTAEDLTIGPLNSRGEAKVSFKLSDGNVPIAPQDNSGERLVKYLLANATKKT